MNTGESTSMPSPLATMSIARFTAYEQRTVILQACRRRLLRRPPCTRAESSRRSWSRSASFDLSRNESASAPFLSADALRSAIAVSAIALSPAASALPFIVCATRSSRSHSSAARADSASPSFSPTDETYSLYISPITSASPPNCSSRYTLQHSFILFPPYFIHSRRPCRTAE